MITAVDWVHDEIEKIWKKDPNFDEIRKIIDQAKEMEKQQKEVDYQSGYLDCYTKLTSEKLTRDI